MYLYCSLAGLLLALVAAASARRNMEGVFVALNLLCTLWMLGSHSPLIGQYYTAIPGFIRGPMYPESAMAAFSLGMATLALSEPVS